MSVVYYVVWHIAVEPENIYHYLWMFDEYDEILFLKLLVLLLYKCET